MSETLSEPLPAIHEIVLPSNNWRPRHYQAPFWDYMQRTPFGARAILCHHRRAGKDHTSINWCATATQQRVGLYLHVFPFTNQGRRIVWNGRDGGGSEFLDAFPPELIESKNNVDMRITLKNGSIYQVIGADDPDKLVGINPVGVILSEFALMDPQAWRLLSPILAENGGWAIFPSTPRGKNHFYDLVRLAIHNPKWFVSIKTVNDTQAIPLERIEEDRKMGMEEALINQEYFVSFEATQEGSYYERQMNYLMDNQRIASVYYDPALPVCTAWDLGIDDSTSIWFFQMAHDSLRIIDYYEASGEGMTHCIAEARRRLDAWDATNDRNFAPFDINVREYSTGQTRISIAARLGWRFDPVRKLSIEDGIECARALLPRCFFDDTRCDRGIRALKSYRKEYDEDNKCYRNRPVHDWASHGADAFRTLAVGLAGHGYGSRRAPAALPREAQSTYDELKL